MFDSMNRIDWNLLHRQKRVLLKWLDDKRLRPSEVEALCGIVHLLDALQDDAVTAGRWMFPGERVQKGGA